jgi:hypothetical protein
MGRYKGVDCFFLTPIARVQVRLRRYASGTGCKGKGTYCNAEKVIDEEPLPVEESKTSGDLHPHDDDRWPEKCEHCGREFKDSDHWQINYDRMFERSDGKPPATIQNAPAGAMWYADWMPDFYRGPDGHCLVVRCPNMMDWVIDGRATNCTKPKDRTHKCWVRIGEPPNVTISKKGNTCSAGAGSIGIGEGDKHYHGFLRDGKLTDG